MVENVLAKRSKPLRFKIGDKVRLTYVRNPFSLTYEERWTGKIFSISQRILRSGLPVYRVQDLNFKLQMISGKLRKP